MSNELTKASDPDSSAISGHGMLIVVSSPSGGGKGTLIDRVLKTVPGVSYSVSYTTRAPRPGEQNGREYFFFSATADRARIRIACSRQLIRHFALVPGVSQPQL